MLIDENGLSILWGRIVGYVKDYVPKAIPPQIIIDDSMSHTSMNPVENRIVSDSIESINDDIASLQAVLRNLSRRVDALEGNDASDIGAYDDGTLHTEWTYNDGTFATTASYDDGSII